MKVLVYQIEGYTEAYNPETDTNERQLTLATISVENPTEAQIEHAEETAYNGVYTIEDNGEPVESSDKERIKEIEEALTLLLEGVTE